MKMITEEIIAGIAEKQAGSHRSIGHRTEQVENKPSGVKIETKLYTIRCFDFPNDRMR